MCEKCEMNGILKLALSRQELNDLFQILADSEYAAKEAQEIPEVKADPDAIANCQYKVNTARHLSMTLAYQLFANLKGQIEKEENVEVEKEELHGDGEAGKPEQPTFNHTSQVQPFIKGEGPVQPNGDILLTPQEKEWFNQMLNFKKN